MGQLANSKPSVNATSTETETPGKLLNQPRLHFRCFLRQGQATGRASVEKEEKTQRNVKKDKVWGKKLQRKVGKKWKVAAEWESATNAKMGHYFSTAGEKLSATSLTRCLFYTSQRHV